eukprot:GHVS01091929.1.p1 GENE.GHVS01091929.1~~GHVS01091929.1.p1  ORF type:complete len:587 (+),score=52.58 GHVS01091929.1:177-1937(+)
MGFLWFICVFTIAVMLPVVTAFPNEMIIGDMKILFRKYDPSRCDNPLILTVEEFLVNLVTKEKVDNGELTNKKSRSSADSFMDVASVQDDKREVKSYYVGEALVASQIGNVLKINSALVALVEGNEKVANWSTPNAAEYISNMIRDFTKNHNNKMDVRFEDTDPSHIINIIAALYWKNGRRTRFIINVYSENPCAAQLTISKMIAKDDTLPIAIHANRGATSRDYRHNKKSDTLHRADGIGRHTVEMQRMKEINDQSSSFMPTHQRPTAPCVTSTKSPKVADENTSATVENVLKLTAREQSSKMTGVDTRPKTIEDLVDQAVALNGGNKRQSKYVPSHQRKSNDDMPLNYADDIRPSPVESSQAMQKMKNIKEQSVTFMPTLPRPSAPCVTSTKSPKLADENTPATVEAQDKYEGSWLCMLDEMPKSPVQGPTSWADVQRGADNRKKNLVAYEETKLTEPKNERPIGGTRARINKKKKNIAAAYPKLDNDDASATEAVADPEEKGKVTTEPEQPLEATTVVPPSLPRTKGSRAAGSRRTRPTTTVKDGKMGTRSTNTRKNNSTQSILSRKQMSSTHPKGGYRRLLE